MTYKINVSVQIFIRKMLFRVNTLQWPLNVLVLLKTAVKVSSDWNLDK